MAKRDKVLGLDIGSSEVRCVEVTTAGDDITITGFGYSPVEDSSKRKEAITAALSRGGLRTKRVVTAVSGRLVPVRYVSMPRLPAEKLKDAVMVEANKYVPFDVEEAVIDCEALVEEPVAEGEEPPSEITVRLVAAKREIIEEHVAELTKAGLFPLIIDHDCFALGNAFELKDTHKPEGERETRVVALVDVGAEKTSINVMSGTNSYFTREVPGGGANLTEAIARRLSIQAEEAEQMKKEPGDRAEDIMEAVLGPLDDLISEIGLSFDYFENQYEKTIEEVLVSGGTCQLKGVMDIFQQHFGKPTSFWDPLEGLKIEVPEHQVEHLKAHVRTIPIAMGLAARAKTLS